MFSGKACPSECNSAIDLPTSKGKPPSTLNKIKHFFSVALSKRIHRPFDNPHFKCKLKIDYLKKKNTFNIFLRPTRLLNRVETNRWTPKITTREHKTTHRNKLQILFPVKFWRRILIKFKSDSSIDARFNSRVRIRVVEKLYNRHT